MASNFEVFNPDLDNAQTDVQYAADTSRLNGLSTGIASTTLHNKLFHQVSVMAAAIGQFISGKGGTASDADVTALTSAFADAVNSNPYGIDPFILGMLAQ